MYQICEPIPDVFWKRLGIRRLIFDRLYPKPAVLGKWNSDNDTQKDLGNWSRIKNDGVVQDLSSIFGSCASIEFADWAGVHDGSGLWDGLYSDVIKPLRKRDFNFLFRLGDVAEKPVSQIDEVLDIIGDYASFGKVTLALAAHEADTLWNRLNGISTITFTEDTVSPAAGERYRFLFNTMRIDSLLILDNDRKITFQNFKK